MGAREVDVPSLADLANAMVGRRVGMDVPGGRPAEAGEETSHVVLWVDAEENAASLVRPCSHVCMCVCMCVSVCVCGCLS